MNSGRSWSRFLPPPLTPKDILALILFVILGVLGNYFRLPMFFGVDFLFGSIAIWLVVYLYGAYWGTLGALVASTPTVFLWGHPYAVIIFTLETLCVGRWWHLRQRNLGVLDGIYWLGIGIPLVGLFYAGALHMEPLPVGVICLKQSVNGIFNTLIATLVIAYLPIHRWVGRRQQSFSLSLRQTWFNLLVIFALVPVLVVILLDSRWAFDDMQRQVTRDLTANSLELTTEIRQEQQKHLGGLQQLAQVAREAQLNPSQELLRSTELLQESLPALQQVFVVNRNGTIIVSDPPGDELREIATPQLVPCSVENAFHFSPTSASLQIQTPVITDNRLQGCVVGQVDQSSLQQKLDLNQHQTNWRFSLLDQQGHTIASTRPNGASIPHLPDFIFGGTSNQGTEHWLRANNSIMIRWQNSYYVQRHTISNRIPWTLVMAIPAAPYIDALQQANTLKLALMFAITVPALFLSQFLSRRLVDPLSRLGQVTTNLPDKLLNQDGIAWPRSAVTEMDTLIRNVQVMATALQQPFKQLQDVNENLEQRVKVRTRELYQTAQDLSAEIAEKTRTEIALRESEERFRVLVTSAPVGIFQINPQGNYVFVNPRWLKITGLSQEEAIGSDWTSNLHPDDQEPIRVAWQTAERLGRQFAMECRLRTPEGKVTWVFASAIAIRDPDGEITGYLGTVTDISDRKQAETDLHRQLQRSQLFADITLKIRQSLQLAEILKTATTEMQTLLKADRVLVYRFNADGSGVVETEAVIPGWPSIEGRQFAAECFGPDYIRYQHWNRISSIADLEDCDEPPCLVELLQQFGVRAKLIAPIIFEDNLWGLLMIHQCDGPRHWNQFEIELTQQVTDQIGIALSQAQLLEHLEEIVADRTAALTTTNRQLQQEVNDRRQAEMALRRSEEQMRLITDAVPALIAYVDPDQRYRFTNQGYETWLGHPRTEINGQLIEQVIGAAVYQKIKTYVEAALSGQLVVFEQEIPFQDGRLHWINATYIPHLAESGEVKGFFALITDISDRKAIERMKDEFISVVSHELRTPLTSLSGSLQLLATGRLGTLLEPGQQMLDIAINNSDRLVRLINDVLDLQRMESDQVVMAKQSCNAADLITESTATMQTMAQQQGVTIVATPASISLWADPDHIIQTLTNLLSNAIKFSDRGGTVWLKAEIIAEEQSSGSAERHETRNVSAGETPLPKSGRSAYTVGAASPQEKLTPRDPITLSPHPSIPPLADTPSQVCFSIRDQGPGIPADKLQTIFERFQQVDASDSRQKGGTGLGLAICKKIVEQHGGQIWVESTLGEGSTFYFTVPQFDRQADPIERTVDTHSP